MRGLVASAVAAVCTLGAPAVASATWSIVAIDPDTQEAGVAVASCVEAPFGTTLLPQVAGVVPGVGALAAQALLSQQWRDQAVMLLADGNPPQDVIDMLVAADPGSASRQYGVVTLDGMTATFTGAATSDWAGDLQSDGVTAQGNILYGPEVVADALAAFEAEAPDCPFTLADRLMVALEAGAAQGGDNRCSMEQTALAAVLIVARPDDTIDAPYIDLRVPSQPPGGDNPVALLRAEYDLWRADNPPDDAGCVDGTTGGGSTGDPPDGTTAGDAETGPATTDPAGSSSSTTDPDPSTSSTPPPQTTTATDTDDPAADSDASGCGCRSAAPGPWLLAPLLVFARRRATRASR